MGLNGTLAVASRALEAFTAGIEVAGQNIANANTPGYIREKLNLTTSAPYRSGNLILGTGVDVGGIQQEINLFLEARIYTANSDASAADARQTIYKQLETQIRELGDGDLSTRLNEFVAGVQDTVDSPSAVATREATILQGERLATDITDLRGRVDELRKAQTINIESLVDEANQLVKTIKELNPRISKLEIGGLIDSDAGGLRTQRYTALNRLSEIVPIRFAEREDGSLDVFTESQFLILANQTQEFQTVIGVDRGVQVQTVRLSQTKTELTDSGGGELQGIIDGRDQILGGFVDKLNEYTGNLIFEFNKVHASGEGLAGYQSVTATNRASVTNVALNQAGLAFTPGHGSFEIKVGDGNTFKTTKIAIDLDGIGTETTLEDLRAALDAVDNVTATISTDGRLKLETGVNSEFRFANDTSGVLAALGINTFFAGTDSLSVAVNSTIADDHRLLATSRGGGPSDNRNVRALATLIDQPISTLGDVSLDDFYNSIVSTVAQSSSAETAVAASAEGFRESLFNQRQQYSGVSLDEEAIHLLQFQRAYQSAARIISTVDELFSILLTI